MAALLLLLTVGLAGEATASGLERFAGTLTSNNDTPLVGRVSINGVNVTSQSSGAFEAYVSFSERYVISASVPGFLPHSEVYEGPALSELRLRLAPAETFTLNPAERVDVTDSRGSRLILPAGALVDAAGNPATGPITLSMHTYNMSTERMVGDMGGVAADGRSVALYALGAVSAEFTDAAGNLYNLAPGSRAQLVLKVPSGTSDGRVPLWWYDMQQGVWREEGSVTVKAGTATGEVAHFTVWNMAMQFNNPACIRLTVDAAWFSDGTYNNRGKPLPLQVMVSAPLPRTMTLDVRSTDVHVLYNLMPDTIVEFRVNEVPYAVASAGAAWGESSGYPSYPYSACKGSVHIDKNSKVALLQGQVQRQFRNTHAGMTVQALIDGSTFTATTNETGNFSLTVPAGTGSVQALSIGYLPARRAEMTMTAGTTSTLPLVTLPAGNVDGSQCVDAADMVLINGAIPSTASSPDDPRDLDGDLRIGFPDLRLAASNGRLCGPMSW
jgi:hypothetical protein